MRIVSRSLGLIVWVLSAVILGASGAWAQDVSVNYAPGTDFTPYKTYRWVDVEGAQKPDQIVDGQIRQAIEKVLASKGLTKVEGDAATLFIAYQIAIGQQQQWNAYNTGGYGWRYGGGMSTATSSTINIGTLALDMYDPAKKELVWKGMASKTLDVKASPEKRQKNIDKAMAKLLKNFPPKPKT